MEKEYSVKLALFGIIKVIAFLISVLILQQLVSMPIGAISAKYWSKFDGHGLNEPFFFSTVTAFLLVTIFVSFVFLKFVDKKNWSYIRVASNTKSRYFIIGILYSFAAVLLFIALTLVSATTEISAKTIAFPDSVLYLIFAFTGIVIAASVEELITRGYFLKTLENHGNAIFAVLVSSSVFSLMHISNSNLSFVGLFNIFLVGGLLGIVCISYNSLWLPLGLHVGWNFLLNLFNFPISGQNYPNPIFKLEYHEYSLVSGSKFGPEDSLFITFLILSLIGFLFIKFRRKLFGQPLIAQSSKDD
ncbi:MAG: lysostaphin resistance A-like protein [bacterium]